VGQVDLVVHQRLVQVAATVVGVVVVGVAAVVAGDSLPPFAHG